MPITLHIGLIPTQDYFAVIMGKYATMLDIDVISAEFVIGTEWTGQ